MFEKRMSERRRVLTGGKIVFNQRGSAIDCTLRNISQTGVQVGVLNALTVPPEFELRWDGNSQRCVVVWRKMNGLGVKFDLSPARHRSSHALNALSVVQTTVRRPCSTGNGRPGVSKLEYDGI
jgi:hypothetical protein